MFSYGITIRNSDAHLIYDASSGNRINFAKPVIIGNHCWISQNTLILKGTNIGEGTILGAGAVVSNKKLQSNSIYAGNPALLVKGNIVWDELCTHGFSRKEKDKIDESKDRFLYKNKIFEFIESIEKYERASTKAQMILDFKKGD